MAGFLEAAKREAQGWPRSLAFWWLMLIAPLLGVGSLSLILNTGALHRMPVALCDQDHSAMSREVTRWLEATPSVRVAAVVDSPEQGHALLRTGKVYAFVLIPRHFERDVLRRRPARIQAFLEGQHLATAGVFNRDLTDLGLAFWRKLDADLRERSGIPASSALMQSSTVALDLRPIANPSANYRAFLLPGLVPALLQLLMTIGMVFALERTARRDGPRQGPLAGALLGTLAPLVLWYWLLGCGLMGFLALHGDLALRSGFSAIALAYLAFTLASAGLSLLLYGLEHNLVGRLSYVSVLSSPAFAFAGLAFPLISMPLLGKIWANLLPLTHLIRIQTQTGLLGSPLTAQAASFGALALLLLGDGLLGLLLSVRRIRKKYGVTPAATHQAVPGAPANSPEGRPS